MSNLILPDRTIRPATLSRRGFLRALGITTAVVAVPGLRATWVHGPVVDNWRAAILSGKNWQRFELVRPVSGLFDGKNADSTTLPAGTLVLAAWTPRGWILRRDG